MKWIVPVFAAIILTGCSLFSSQTSQDNKSDTTGEASLAESIIYDENLLNFFQAFTNQESYTIAITQETESEAQEFSIQFQKPDKIRTTTPTDEGVAEFIYINEDSYMLMPGTENWIKLSIPRTDEVLDIGDIDIESWQTQASDYPEAFEYQGEQPCRDLTCHQYAFTDNQGNQTIIAFDTQEYLLRNVTTISQDQITTTMIFTYDDVDIIAPETAEEFSIPENPTKEDIEKLQEMYGSE